MNVNYVSYLVVEDVRLVMHVTTRLTSNLMSVFLLAKEYYLTHLPVNTVISASLDAAVILSEVPTLAKLIHWSEYAMKDLLLKIRSFAVMMPLVLSSICILLNE